MFFKKRIKTYNFNGLNRITYDYEDDFFTITNSEMIKILSQKNTFLKKIFGTSNYIKEVEELKQKSEIDNIRLKILNLKSENQKYEKIMYDYLLKYLINNQKAIEEIKKTEKGNQLLNKIFYYCENYSDKYNEEYVKKILSLKKSK